MKMFCESPVSLRAVCAAAVLCAGLGLSAATPARAQGGDFGQWLQGLRSEARGAGISERTLDAALTGVTPNPRVIELDRRQSEFTLTFEQYRSRVAPQSRIDRGRRLYAENKPLLDEISAAYGVPARFIVALWGVETDFGRNTGGYSVVRSLATLAHDGRRSEYFRKELLNALRIIDEGHITAEAMIGSWAGAMGQSQFMPSSFLSRAVDWDRDGRRDIWTTRADVFASAANYLKNAGWDGRYTWGREVRLPRGFDRALLGLDTRKPLETWARLGVRRADGGALPVADITGSIIVPDRSGGRAFIVYDNFRSILRWNRSFFFALTVGYLADRIGGN